MILGSSMPRLSWLPRRAAAVHCALETQALDHMRIGSIRPDNPNGTFIRWFLRINLGGSLLVSPVGLIGKSERYPVSVRRPGCWGTNAAGMRKLDRKSTRLNS